MIKKSVKPDIYFQNNKLGFFKYHKNIVIYFNDHSIFTIQTISSFVILDF